MFKSNYPTRKDEIAWRELIDQCIDMSDVNNTWLLENKKKHVLEIGLLKLTKYEINLVKSK